MCGDRFASGGLVDVHPARRTPSRPLMAGRCAEPDRVPRRRVGAMADTSVQKPRSGYSGASLCPGPGQPEKNSSIPRTVGGTTVRRASRHTGNLIRWGGSRAAKCCRCRTATALPGRPGIPAKRYSGWRCRRPATPQVVGDAVGPVLVADGVARPLVDGGSIGGTTVGVEAEPAGPVDQMDPVMVRPLLSDAAVAGHLDDQRALLRRSALRLEALAAGLAHELDDRVECLGRRRSDQTGDGCYRHSEQ